MLTASITLLYNRLSYFQHYRYLINTFITFSYVISSLLTQTVNPMKIFFCKENDLSVFFFFPKEHVRTLI